MEAAEKYREVFGIEVAYDYLRGLIRYALYKEESEDQVVNALVCSLKNTIDANQSKRASGFSKENKEMTEAILSYKNAHPDATQRDVSNAVGCSVGKVNKVLGSSNFNSNSNINANLNTNSVNLNMNNVQNCTQKSACEEKAAIAEAGSFYQKRSLKDLEESELDALMKDLRAGRNAGMTYCVLYKKYRLEDGCLSKDTIDEIKKLKDDLETKEYFRKQRESRDRTFKHLDELFSNGDFEGGENYEW